jgi:hypothetical protein
MAANQPGLNAKVGQITLSALADKHFPGVFGGELGNKREVDG